MAKSDLTPKQKATIDRLLAEHPDLKPENVNGYYENCYMYGWKIYIEIPGVSFSYKIHLAHCDHKTTASDKGIAFRDYIAQRKAAQS